MACNIIITIRIFVLNRVYAMRVCVPNGTQHCLKNIITLLRNMKKIYEISIVPFSSLLLLYLGT